MHIRPAAMTAAILSAFSPAAYPQTAEKSLPPLVVTASPFGSAEDAQVLAPAKVIGGNALRDKLAPSLGDTLGREPGIQSSGFGAASRPVIRGMDGPRIKTLQNGMSTSDLSALSNDHAVAAEPSGATQIEILRGPATLIYGSGAIGGLINVVTNRIPTQLAERPAGEVELRAGSADRSLGTSFEADGATGRIALHVDGYARRAENHDIPGNAALSGAPRASGRLPGSHNRNHGLAFGGSLIADWGYAGASVSAIDNRYGIPGSDSIAPPLDDGGFIALRQTRLDLDSMIRQPFSGIDSIKLKLGNADYRHTEHEADGTPAVNFRNDEAELRLQAVHAPVAGWKGVFGVHADRSRFSALDAAGGPALVPVTRSRSAAVFGVEEREFPSGNGPVAVNAGLRLESQSRTPAGDVKRDFSLVSAMAGGLWKFTPGYAGGMTFGLAQRAPAVEELYANGAHDATQTFDIGSNALKKETSRNIELTLQKTEGLVRWKINAFHNRARNFIYGATEDTDGDGAADRVDESMTLGAGNFLVRRYSQAGATIRGLEAELGYNQSGNGWSARAFADISRGKLDGAGSLPLQPATRFGAELGYKAGAWHGEISAVRARSQHRLASFETATPGYTRLDASLSYTARTGKALTTWFLLAKNLLDEDVRLSTSVLKDTVPQPGRSFVIGMRTRF